VQQKGDLTYPEFSDCCLVRVVPSMTIGKRKTTPELLINLALSEIFRSQGLRKRILAPNQLQAYMIWQGIKVEAAKKGTIIADKDFFTNEEMGKHLLTLSPADLVKIEFLAGKVFGARMTDEVREELVRQSSLRRLGAIKR
jgi:hypothetical protein